MKKSRPTLTEEEKVLRQGMVLIGVDEAGRGPLAGPVVAAAVALERLSDDLLALAVDDSKVVSPKRRIALFLKLTHHPHIRWSVGMASHTIIDEINVLQASLLAMRDAVGLLYPTLEKRGIAYIDGREIIPGLVLDQRALIGGDATVFSIAAASIIAKVTRDAIMYRYASQYPEYQFDKHKGYGTKLHFDFLKKHGPCPIHRKSFITSVVAQRPKKQ